MRYYFALSLVLLSFICATAQEKSNPYSDLTPSGEVFFDGLIYKIQNQEYPRNSYAFPLLNQAVEYYSSKNDKCGLGKSYGTIARIFYEEAQFDSATTYFVKADKFLTNNCKPFDTYFTYNSWGIFKNAVNQYDQARLHLDKALQATQKINEPSLELNVLINISISLSKQNKLREAIINTQNILAEAKEFESIYHIEIALQNLGSYFIDLSKYDSARYYFLQLQEIVDTSQATDVVLDMYNNLGLTYAEEGNYEKAIWCYKKSMQISEDGNMASNVHNSYSNIAQVYHIMGNHKKSWEYIQKYIKAKEDADPARLQKIEAEFKLLQEREKTLQAELQVEQQKLETEKGKRNRNILVSVVSGLFIILIAVYSRLRYIRRSKKIVEREKKRSDDLLRNILPEEVAEELKNTGKSDARNFNHVTVLFTDFVDFTSISQQKSAAEMVEDINYYFKKFDEIVTHHNIEKIKTIGDSFMAAGGVPVEFTEAPKATVLAALEMMDVVNKRNEQNREAGKPIFNMRIGIHTGPVVAGIVGLKKFQYDIWGDTVNTASRMESASEINQINISKSTYDLLKDDSSFSFEKRGKIETKGKGKLDMYYVTLA